jgi:hypothetical protein
MKKFKNHQRPRRKYRFDIVGHKKALKSGETVPLKGRRIQTRDRRTTA